MSTIRPAPPTPGPPHTFWHKKRCVLFSSIIPTFFYNIPGQTVEIWQSDEVSPPSALCWPSASEQNAQLQHAWGSPLSCRWFFVHISRGCLRDDRAGWGGEILQSRLLVNLTPLFLFNGLFGQQGAVLTSRFSSAWPYQSWPFLLCPACLPFSYILWNLVLSSGARSSHFPCCRKRSSTFRFES